MLDTVRLRSPSLDEATVHIIEKLLERRSAVSMETGEVRYQFTTGPLVGSWDTRVQVQVEREAWAVPSVVMESAFQARQANGKRLKRQAVRVPSEPYLIVEGSVHKAAQGNNIYGGPERFLLAVEWFVADVADRLGVTLPAGRLWVPLRVDWAECYDLGSFEAVQDFMRGIRSASYPKRKPSIHGDETVCFPSRVATPKLYHKGPEFSTHDRSRLAKCLEQGALFELQERANGILRTETSIKDRALEAEYGTGKTCAVVQETWLNAVHDREIDRILREGKTTMETVRHHLDVSRRLHEVYGQELASRLYGTWFQLSTLAEAEVRGSMNRATFYRQRKQLEEAGVSWHATNVIAFEAKSYIPAGFSPTRKDPRRMTGESEAVRLRLDSYRDRVSIPGSGETWLCGPSSAIPGAVYG